MEAIRSSTTALKTREWTELSGQVQACGLDMNPHAGIPASRQIVRKLAEGAAFRVSAANRRPDFLTLSDFRKQHLTALADLFGRRVRGRIPCGNFE